MFITTSNKTHQKTPNLNVFLWAVFFFFLQPNISNRGLFGDAVEFASDVGLAARRLSRAAGCGALQLSAGLPGGPRPVVKRWLGAGSSAHLSALYEERSYNKQTFPRKKRHKLN